MSSAFKVQSSEFPVSLLAALLRGEAVEWPVDADGAAEDRFVEQAIRHGVAPLVARLLSDRSSAGWPASLRERLWQIEAEAVGLAILRERELPRVLERVAAANVRPIIIKGAALAHTHYPASHLRPSSDVDLFIDVAELDDLGRALESLGYQRAHLVAGDLIMPQVSYERADTHGTRQIYDIHWKLARPQAFVQAVTYLDLIEDLAPLPALGPAARVPSDVQALLIACVHRIAHHSDEARLIWLYDIHLLADRFDAAQFRRFVDLAGTRRVSGVCAAGLAAARQWFDTRLPPGVLETLEEQSITSGEASRAFINGQTNISLLLSDLKLIAGWQERLRLLQQHVFPPRAYMFRTYGTSSRPLLPALYTRRLLAGAWRWLTQSYRAVVAGTHH